MSNLLNRVRVGDTFYFRIKSWEVSDSTCTLHLHVEYFSDYTLRPQVCSWVRTADDYLIVNFAVQDIVRVAELPPNSKLVDSYLGVDSRGNLVELRSGVPDVPDRRAPEDLPRYFRRRSVVRADRLLSVERTGEPVQLTTERGRRFSLTRRDPLVYEGDYVLFDGDDHVIVGRAEFERDYVLIDC